MTAVEFIVRYWDWIILVCVLLYPFIQPNWIQQNDSYWDNLSNQWRPVNKFSILQAFINLAVMPLTVFLSLRGTVSLVIFLVIAIDLIYRKQLSREAVILVSIGIVALYLEQLIEKGEEFSFFGILRWKSRSVLNNREIEK
jgi:hypothetical protein